MQNSVRLKNDRGIFIFSLHVRSIHNEIFLLNHSVADVRRFWDVSALNASAYEKFNIHIKRPNRGTFRRRVTRIQEKVMLLEPQGTDERRTISTEVRSSSQSMVH